MVSNTACSKKVSTISSVRDMSILLILSLVRRGDILLRAGEPHDGGCRQTVDLSHSGSLPFPASSVTTRVATTAGNRSMRHFAIYRLLESRERKGGVGRVRMFDRVARVQYLEGCGGASTLNMADVESK